MDNINTGWFKKGQHNSPNTEFKKGTSIRLGIKHTEEAKEKIKAARARQIPIWTGRKHSEKSLQKMSNSLKGLNKGIENSKWKGENVGYRGLHTWIQRTLGTPEQCTHCPKIATGHSMHWANRSGEYRRDISDWIRLCAKCHGIYDSNKKIEEYAR